MESVEINKRLARDWSKMQIVRVVGISYIVMGILGFLAEFGFRARLIVWDDAMLTLSNIQNSAEFFKVGILAFLIIILLDIVIAIAFYALLSSVSKSTALLMTSLRLLYVAIKGAAMIGLFLAKDVYTSTIESGLSQTALHAAQALQFLKFHDFGFSIGLLFFGVHLIFLARLLMKVREVPKFIVWLLLVGGVGYSVNSLGHLFASDVELLQTVIIIIFIIPMTFSELLLGVWLLVKRKKLMIA
uniref:DUF4386 domain-containing protein n=1 Tax=Roseihalotalea indica TaxID=2867963 RepID=A0AA49GPB8_9BACT|nr:DUF4386 domain-containing protein [Tunicatimonas sp. TK19036]